MKKLKYVTKLTPEEIEKFKQDILEYCDFEPDELPDLDDHEDWKCFIDEFIKDELYVRQMVNMMSQE